jgi:uncharacterized protein (DUF1778 family)
MAHTRTTKAKAPPKKTKLVKAYFPKPQLNRLEKAAKHEGISVSSFVVKTIVRQLDDAEAK